MLLFPRRPLPGLLFALALVALIGVADLATGPEVSFSVFYLLPIYLATWSRGRTLGMAVAVASSLVWLGAELLSAKVFSHPLIPYWNMMVRFSFFLITILLLTEVKIRERRRREMERIFFHDVLNTATAIRGFSELMKENDGGDDREMAGIIHTASEQMIEEIEAQRSLTAAESHELKIAPGLFSGREVLAEVADWYRTQDIARGKTIQVLASTANDLCLSDRILVRRILANMLKNALEASPGESTVVLESRQEGKELLLSVRNPGEIPDEIRDRLFRPDVSTKGMDRGLGTFSMQRLARALGGHVTCRSGHKEGTLFTLHLPIGR